MASVKLTPNLKHLLTLRNPNVLPSPSLPQLNRVFTKTFRDAQAKKAETGWLVATVCLRAFHLRDVAEFELYLNPQRQCVSLTFCFSPYPCICDPNTLSRPAACYRRTVLQP